uniref:HU family DNA-binding protein n=1 Tax=Marinobacterium profundum TaxID=1714300 RepID=UPI00082AE880|nr:HU family DNA-binding protein [Marinobacterium profundum]
MNQAQLIERITTDLKASGVAVSKTQVEAVVMRLAETVADTLVAGDEVLLSRLGKFSLAHRAARLVRNPATGAPLALPEMRAVKFKPLKGLKDAVNA